VDFLQRRRMDLSPVGIDVPLKFSSTAARLVHVIEQLNAADPDPRIRFVRHADRAATSYRRSHVKSSTHQPSTLPASVLRYVHGPDFYELSVMITGAVFGWSASFSARCAAAYGGDGALRTLGPAGVGEELLAGGV